MRRKTIRSIVAIATAIALCPSVAMATDPPAAAPPAPVATAPAPVAPAPATATAGPATAVATPSAPQAQAQPPVEINAPTNVAVTVNTSQAQAQSQPQPAPAPETRAAPQPPPPPPVVVAPAYVPGIEDHPIYGPRYRAASGVMFTGVGFLIAGPAVLLTITLPAYGLQKAAVDNAREADDLKSEQDALDAAYRRNVAAQASGITALAFTALGLALTVGGGVARSRARREYDRTRARIEPAAGGVTIRF